MRMWHANNYPYSWHLPGGITKSLIWDSRFWGSDVTLGCPLVYKHNCKDPWSATYFSQHGKYLKYFKKCLSFPMCSVQGSLKTWMRCFRSQIFSCMPEWVGSYWFSYSKISLWSPSHCISKLQRNKHGNAKESVTTLQQIFHCLHHLKETTEMSRVKARESWLKWYNFSLGGALFDSWLMHQLLWPWYFNVFLSPSIKLWEITIFGPCPLNPHPYEILLVNTM